MIFAGKWHLGSSDPVKKNERGGYNYWLASNLLEFTSDSYDTIIYDKDNKKIKLPGYRIDAIVDAAIRYINQKRKKPFFLFISLIEGGRLTIICAARGLVFEANISFKACLADMIPNSKGSLTIDDMISVV